MKQIQILILGIFAVLIMTACGSEGGTATKTSTVNPTTAYNITHNGVTYGTVVSPYTGKTWLDRNLGAAQVCRDLDDTACYGDYYQWGRNADGHEDSLSGITDMLATDVNNAGMEFIIVQNANTWDWAGKVDPDASIRTANWSKTDGSSVCPVGFRVPTITELKAELSDVGSAQISNNLEAFNSFLSLPSAGVRYPNDGSMGKVGLVGNLWSSSPTWFMDFDLESSYDDVYASHAYGFSVRCLKD